MNKKYRYFFLWIFVLLGCIACKTPQSASSHPVNDNEVIYHVVQRSFYDSNGDKHGDLNGLRSKLDYLQELGVTSILLLPLYHSEYYHNYFATDFEKIDPEFGTMDDYLALVKDIHKRGMKLYMDMETQYITEDHQWYKSSFQNPKSEYSDYLVYNGAGNTEPESIIFGLTSLTGFDGTTRKITTVDLRSEDVLTYNKSLFSYWIDPNRDGRFDDGVDGFRLDHMMDDLDGKGKFTNLFEEFWSPLIRHVKSVNPRLKIIAEQANWESFGTDYVQQAGVDNVFAFNLMYAIPSFDKEKISKVIDSTFNSVPHPKQQIVFIENHDIHRFASKVNHDQAKLKAAAVMNLTLGGTPLIYYGQEIGMSGAGGFGKFGNTDANDIPMREAFEWHSTVNGDGMTLWYRNTGPWWDQTNLKDNDGISLEEQRENTNSLWNTYRSLLALRKNYPALATGTYRELANNNPHMFAFVRETPGQRIVVVMNLSDKDGSLALNAEEHRLSGTDIGVLFGNTIPSMHHHALNVTLPAFGSVIIELR